MNFFAGQDQARRNTGLLVAMFVLAVFVLLVLTNMLVMVALGALNLQTQPDGMPRSLIDALVLDWNLVAAISAGVLLVVAMATFFRMMQLSGGGAAIAEGMGGKRVTMSTTDALERRLLNIVAEMAIASGTPVPRVYMLEGETGINAFAAGFSSSNAVIGITRGALNQLDRDELQGVIAHEFSHILNGDMRLNLRLIGVLHGILFLATIGYFILRSGGGPRISRNRGGGGTTLLLGIGLIVIGSGGSFFGNMIKAAVSRQREYLADASAVQFTRNPGGLAGALKRIGSTVTQGQVAHARAAEASHMFFSDALMHRFSSAFATHPPLAERITRLDSRWRGKFDVPRSTQNEQPGVSAFVAENARPSVEPTAQASLTGASSAPLELGAGATIAPPEPLVHDAVTPEFEPFLAGIPLDLREIAGSDLTAPTLACALLLDNEGDCRDRQLAILAGELVSRDEQAGYFASKLASVSDRNQLALIELCSPALTGLSTSERAELLVLAQALFAELEQPGLRRWAVFRQLEAMLSSKPAPGPQFRRLAQLRASLEIVLSALARSGDLTEQECLSVLDQANTELELQGLRLVSEGATDRHAIDRALAKLARAFPLLKPRILKACILVIHGDGRVTSDESLMLQLIATAIDCPAPALIELPAA